MTAQQEADLLLKDHQLTRLLKELELDIASVVTAHYNPQPIDTDTGIDLTIEDWGLLNDQPHPTILAHFDRLLA